MAVPVWAQEGGPAFTLTAPFLSAQSRMLEFNVQQADRLYLLDQRACSFVAGDVRATKYNIPQADGSILPRRFLTGAVMELSIGMLETRDKPACDDLLTDMLDDLLGSFRSLLNAGDNAGRITWEVAGEATRMLDDCRLLVYPKHVVGDVWDSVVVTIDSRFPYAQSLLQTRTGIEDGSTVTVSNAGTADELPVFQVNRLNGVTAGTPVSAFTITNVTTGVQFDWDDSLPGASAIPANHYAELSCFDNTIYKDGDSTNEDPGIVQLSSDYFGLVPGDNEIEIVGADCDVLSNNAFG